MDYDHWIQDPTVLGIIDHFTTLQNFLDELNFLVFFSNEFFSFVCKFIDFSGYFKEGLSGKKSHLLYVLKFGVLS
jgi:hypothetical protein